MTTIGEIELNPLPNELIVQWKIKGFSSLSDFVYSSGLFSFANESWCLMIYPNGSSYSGYISVYLRRKSSGSSIKIELSFSLKKVDENTYLEKHEIGIFQRAEVGQGPTNFLSRSELLRRKSELMPFDILTIICTLKRPKSTEDIKNGLQLNVYDDFKAKGNKDKNSAKKETCKDEEEKENEAVSSKMKGLEILSENLKQVLLDGRMTDVVLKAGGQEFNVHKIILVARSPVFASMFQHDLAEKKSNEVDIPDCRADSFQVFLHYLYSGSVETLSTTTVYNVYYAADKYQVDDLKEKCLKFMMKNITVETFCDVIALSLRHGETELQKTATDFFCANAKTIVKTVQWQKYLDVNSTQANELFIKALNA